MKINKYAALAVQAIVGVANHHDTPAAEVEAELDKLVEFTLMLKAGLPTARKEYANMRDAEAKQAKEMQTKRLAGVK